MSQPIFFNCNGKIYRHGTPVISIDNRSFRYGDGCFETIKVKRGKMILEDYHFERLIRTLEELRFKITKNFTASFLSEQIEKLLIKNKHEDLARVRLTVFRGDGGLYELENNVPNYAIESWKLNENLERLNENGLVVGIYKEARKAVDRFSQLKTNNFICYLMAAIWAKERKFNDALVLNSYGNIADATIANLFIVVDGIIKTPALTEGPVAGTMRRYLIKKIREEGLPFEESEISVELIKAAKEVFFTNSIYGIKWVQQIDETGYSNEVSGMLYNKFIKSLFD